mgnify:CR=1 FL=1
MIFYSTGKGSYLKGRGAPIDLDTNGTTVDVLLSRGFIVRTLEELDEVQKPIEQHDQLFAVTDIESVQETIKKERKKRETKKPVKTRQKRSTNR